MEKKVVKRVVEVEDVAYVALDGTVFDNENECATYDERLRTQECSVFELPLIKDVAPISERWVYEDTHYRWYKIENETQFEIIKRLYEEDGIEFAAPLSYPTLCCIHEDYDGATEMCATSDTLCAYTTQFWDALGYDVEIKKR